MANLCSWLFLLGPAPFAFCFASLLDGETHIWLGDLRSAFCVVVFVFCFVFDLPCWPFDFAFESQQSIEIFFCARARCLSAGLRYLRLTRLPRYDRSPVPGGNRSAASCPCTVLRRASYHYATKSRQQSDRELGNIWPSDFWIQ